MNAWLKFFLAATVVTFVSAWLLYDPWLRPTRLVVAWALIIMLLSGFFAFLRSAWLKAISAFMLAAFIIVSPIASLRRYLTIRNSTESQVMVQVQHEINSQARKSKLLLVGEVWTFTYFAGDYGNTTNVPVVFSITNIGGHVGRSVGINLPTETNPSPIILTKDWFVE